MAFPRYKTWAACVPLVALLLVLASLPATSARSRKSIPLSRQSSPFLKNFRCDSFANGSEFCQLGQDGALNLRAYYSKMGSFTSRNFYKYGMFSVRMKFPPGYSGGIIPCMYLISGGNKGFKDVHDEIDFEFLGGQNPREMIIHTNLITNGYNKLEQFKFPFDPSAAYHRYSILWSPSAVTWFVDSIPIRIAYRRNGPAFPSKPLRIRGSIWDSSEWSALKSNFNNGPITVSFKNFNIQGCRVSSRRIPSCATYKAGWQPWMYRMSGLQKKLYVWFQKYHVYKKYSWEKTV
ncbi:hypothetical protein CLOM_g24139 [Closterium sp. NIES-68]|nr:hypothetical protein CLOM_g24139 [Closterium sp. NIES-68]GJP74102.1 hypothetical protein CLOP_g4737 [Closterium sp. NIES-67]